MTIHEQQIQHGPRANSAPIAGTEGSALVVLNPVAGGIDPHVCGDVEAACRGAGMTVGVVRTSRRGEAVDLVADRVRRTDDLRLVVAIGGDGTVREVAEGMARGLGRWPCGSVDKVEDGPSLFIVPSGTGNSVYRAIWGEVSWTEAMAKVLLGDCRVRALDLARLVEFDTAAFLGTSVGLTARITELAAQMLHVPGRQRYWLAAATALANLEPIPIDVQVDGRSLYRGAANIVAIGGGRHRAGVFQLLPRSVLDDGLLDVCVVGELAAEEIEPFAALIPDGAHLGRPEVRYAQGRRVSVTRSDGTALLAEVDGDVHSDAGTAITLEVVSGAVPVAAPTTAPAG